jgi:hypothetical protein
LIARLELRGKTIVEIGCGQGDFLRLLCERGDNRGIGFDPSYVPASSDREGDRVRIVKDLYDERHAQVEADFILSRQTLEHVAYPRDMLDPLRRSIGDRLGTPVFFEVPNAAYTLRHTFIWDVIYEHPSYFTAPALATALARSGFRVSETYESFGGQYLCVTAYPAEPDPACRIDPTAKQRLLGDVQTFRSAYQRYVDGWRKTLRDLASKDRSIALWGAGSKGVMFANLFDLRSRMSRVVDVNPKKHGMYVAGQGQRIVHPRDLAADPVDVIIVANPIYKNEVAMLTQQLGLSPEFLYL